MSPYHSITDALASWHELDSKVPRTKPETITPAIRERMKGIDSALDSDGLAISLAQSLKAMWWATVNEDGQPGPGEMSGFLLLCSEVAWLITRAIEAEDSITHRLRQADLYEAQHGGQQS
ncbi:MAG: hypothetical protein ABFS39_19380 [Pseudomonadota bacterium]